MTSTVQRSAASPSTQADVANALALSVAHAENELQSLAAGQVDAIVDPEGRTYLLRPAQERLRKNERRLRILIDSVADVITVVNRGGLILSQNLAMSRVLGYAPESLVGTNFFALVHPDDLLAVCPPFFDVIEGCRDEAKVYFRHRMPDQSYRALEATIGKWRDGLAMNVVFSMRPTSSNGAIYSSTTIERTARDENGAAQG